MNTTQSLPTIDLFVFDGLADWEIGFLTAHVNRFAGQFLPGRFAIRTVGASAEVRTMGGLRLSVDATLEETKGDTPALWILPGGVGWDAGEHSKAVDRAAALLELGVPVAAICGATAGLAKRGLLDDRKHTSNAREYLAATGYAGASLYVDDEVVEDRGLITAGSTAALAFAREAMRAIEAHPEPVIDGWYNLFRTGEARYFFALMSAMPRTATS